MIQITQTHMSKTVKRQENEALKSTKTTNTLPKKFCITFHQQNRPPECLFSSHFQSKRLKKLTGTIHAPLQQYRLTFTACTKANIIFNQGLSFSWQVYPWIATQLSAQLNWALMRWETLFILNYHRNNGRAQLNKRKSLRSRVNSFLSS